VQHKPVMLAEVVEHLAVKASGCYVDCTFGRGGHSQELLSLLGANGRLLALDRDIEAVESEAALSLLKDKRFQLIHARFSDLKILVAEKGWLGQVDGILLDLGVSSPQLDSPERGFSFMQEGPLDMRMDKASGISAADWLAKVEEKELVRVLFEFGEERFARRIARSIIAARNEASITTTQHLVELIEHAVPGRERNKHPATRTFQAIRIQINKELDELGQVLEQSLALLGHGGRLVVISFHSLEDRIVKRFINAESGGKNDPGRLPVKQSEIKPGLLKKIGKPVKASEQEIAKNPRARSAIMRVAEKI
jgi:16S rRNA (cytosine1402-N4)-methyltransferase